MHTPPHMRRIEEAADRAREARSLLRLWDALEVYSELLDVERVDADQGGLDMAALPTFGGDRPTWVTDLRVEHIRSWDETHAVVETNAGARFLILPREARPC